MTDLKRRPVITLTTDFGTSDHYVGTMKCVIAGICPEALVIDITHQIAPGDVYSAAYAISQSASFSPPGTIHVVVVDPGVGTARRAISVQANGQTFIAPDNGVLSFILPQRLRGGAKALSNPKLHLSVLSSTFHGRDLFSPSAAALAAQLIEWEEVGPDVEDCIQLPGLHAVPLNGGRWQASVLSIDHFGNVISSLPVTLSDLASKPFKIKVKEIEISMFCRTFQESSSGALFVYPGSSGYYEIAINRGRASDALGIKTGDPIILDLNA